MAFDPCFLAFSRVFGSRGGGVHGTYVGFCIGFGAFWDGDLCWMIVLLVYTLDLAVRLFGTVFLIWTGTLIL